MNRASAVAAFSLGVVYSFFILCVGFAAGVMVQQRQEDECNDGDCVECALVADKVSDIGE